MGRKKLHQMTLILPANPLKVENFPKVGIRLVSYMNEVGLDKGLGRRRANLEGFDERGEARHGLNDALGVG